MAPITIDVSGLTAWFTSKTTISTIASVIVYVAGARGLIDYSTAVQISTVLMGLAAVFMRNAVAKVETKLTNIEDQTTK